MKVIKTLIRNYIMTPQILDESPWLRYVLALLYVAKGEIIGSIKLHKEMFLISRSIPELLEDDLYGPHDYGPYSEEIDEDIIGLLEIEGLLKVKHTAETSIYELTLEGKKIADVAYKQLDENAKISIKRVHELIDELTSDEILFIIYFMYPKMAKYSKVFERINKNKVKLAAGIYKKKKMSLKHLSKLAEVDEEEILAKM